MTSKAEALHADALDAFRVAVERDAHNRKAFEDDIRFGRLGEQWEDADRASRKGRPCLTINKLGPVIRQVVNDARQNKPAIKVMPQDSAADVETAEIMSGLIRNIEAASDADIAYDTAVDNAVAGGFGYFRINLAYACDDNWDQDIVFEAVPNPLAIVGDPDASSADGSDWNCAFVTDSMSKKAFERDFPGAQALDWDSLSSSLPSGWADEGRVQVAEYWTRDRVARKIVLLSDGSVVDLAAFEKDLARYQAAGIFVEGRPREVLSYRVRQHLMNGAEILRTTDWAGKFIPIIPVYGDEVNLKGKRHFSSLIRPAKDAQRMFNYDNSIAVETGALAPKVPWIGPKEAFDADAEKWETAHTTQHPFIRYKGAVPPQRQPVGNPPSSYIQTAQVAGNWIQDVTGIYNASLGAPSNETSGRAILARQREGDVSTFHFIDNLSRSIRHGGRVLIDLIPKVYTPQRMIRVLGEDGQARNVALNTPQPVIGPDGKPKTDARGQAITRLFDLSAGKYDLSVAVGPSFTTRREEAANQMIEFIRAYPAAAPVLGDLLARNLDWPGAAEIETRLRAHAEAPDPAVAAEAQAQAQLLQSQVHELSAVLENLMKDRAIDERKLMIDAFKAETQRMQAVLATEGAAADPEALQAMVAASVAEILASPGGGATNNGLALNVAPRGSGRNGLPTVDSAVGAH